MIRNIIPTQNRKISADTMKVGQAGFIVGDNSKYKGELLYKASNEAYISLGPSYVSWSFMVTNYDPEFEIELLPKGTVVELVLN